MLVGNKLDLRLEEDVHVLEDYIKPLMAEYREVETSVECSAKTPINVSEVFYFAIKAVMHPTAPIYDCRDYALKPRYLLSLSKVVLS